MSASAPHPPEPPPDVFPAGRGVHIWRTAVIMPFITFTFVALRFYSRSVILKRKMTIDDYVVAGTMVTIIIHAILMAQATYNGMGLHVWQYTPELNSRYYLWIGISSEFYVLSLAGFKSALILLYLQLFGLTSRKFRIACYITLFYTLGYLTCNALTEFLGCNPIAKKWQSNLPGKCINGVAANIAYGAGHMSSDLIIAILPLVMIWRLEFQSVKQKIGLSLVLCTGFVAWAVACVRWAISTYNMLSYDRPWWAGISFLFSILEVNTGLICACVATLNPVTSLFFTRVKEWSTGRTNSTQRSKFSETNPSQFSRPSKGQIELQHDIAQVSSKSTYASHNQYYYPGSTRNNSVGAASDSTDRLYKEDFDSLTSPTLTHSPELGNMPTSNQKDQFSHYDLHGLQAMDPAHRR